MDCSDVHRGRLRDGRQPTVASYVGNGRAVVEIVIDCSCGQAVVQVLFEMRDYHGFNGHLQGGWEIACSRGRPDGLFRLLNRG